MAKPSRPAGSRPLRAALYERVSTKVQGEGYSLDAQDRAGRLYFETHGLEAVPVYRDEGRSAHG
jgi:site-specific DNA recombinase